MAVAAGGVWEVRTSGNVQNGGCFVTGASGTDYSQQDAAQYALTGVTSAGAGNVVLSASAAAAMVGNIGYVVSGTNFTAGTVTAFFQVTSVSLGVSITFSTNVAGTAISTGVGANGVINIGGANTDPAIVAANLVAGHIVHQKAGTYAITSATPNVAGGCVSLGVRTTWYGYQTTRGDLGTKPLLQASGISTASLFAAATNSCIIVNIEVDGASLTAIRGLTLVANRGLVLLCTARNCTNGGLFSSVAGGGRLVRCLATGCSTFAAISIGNHVFACIAVDNTVTGFSLITAGAEALFCIADSNTGATSDGFIATAINGGTFTNCVAYGNGRDGFALVTQTDWGLTNCLSEANAQYGFNGSGVGHHLQSCGAYDNSSGANNLTALLINHGFVNNVTASFFTNAAAGDFNLNTTASAGAAARAAGIPGIFPGGLTTGYLDMGAAQHADPAAGGGVNRALLPSGVSALG